METKNGQGIIRAGHGKKKRFLMPPHPLINFGVYSRDNLSKAKDGAYVIKS